MAEPLREAGAAMSFEEFLRVDLRVGTVLSAEPNANAKKPAYVLKLDFGVLGRMTTSAQITDGYAPAELVGRQVIAVVNLPSRLVGGIASEVQVLGAVPADAGVVLLRPDYPVANGTRIG
jgi:tRNA-binding protein